MARRLAGLTAVFAVILTVGAAWGFTAGSRNSATTATIELAGGTTAPAAEAETGPSTATAQTRTEPAHAPAAPTLTQAVGQMLISRVTGTVPSASLLKRIRGGRVGSVILYSENIVSSRQLAALTQALQRAAKEGHNPPLLIGTDQEGGPVKRLTSAPPWLSAAQMGMTSHARSVAQAEGKAAGRALLKLGVNEDFAPVADIPTSANNFLGERAFGDSARVVEQGVDGFATGLAEAHVAGTLKHFPGLGGAGAHNTDLEVVRIGLSSSQLRAAYAPYRSVARLGASVAPLVMISNAIYPALHSNLPADLTPSVVRNELVGTGLGNRVTITDDLQVPAVERYPDAAVKAVRAGIDLLMFAQEEAASERAFNEITAAVKAGQLRKEEVLAAAGRVTALKTAIGAH